MMETIPNFEWIETSYRDGVTEWHCYVGKKEAGRVVVNDDGRVWACSIPFAEGKYFTGFSSAERWVESKWKDFHKVSE